MRKPNGGVRNERVVGRLRNRDWFLLIMAVQQERRISQSSSVVCTLWFLNILTTPFFFAQNTVFWSEYSLYVLSSCSSVCLAYSVKSSRLRYFPLVCMPRHLHPRLCYESVSAQYSPVLAMCCLRATRIMGAALLQVCTVEPPNFIVPCVDFELQPGHLATLL